MFRNSTNIIAVTATLFCVVSIGVYAGFLTFVERHKANLADENAAYVRLVRNTEAIHALTNRLAATDGARVSLASRILPEEGVIDFLTLVETIGDEGGVTLTTDTLAVEPVDDMFETLVVRMSLEGSYPAIMRTLALFEHLPYQVVVSGVALTRKEGGVWSGTWSIRVTKYTQHETQR